VSSNLNDKILLGRVSGLFGVRGWLKLFSYSRPPENILSYNPLWLKTPMGWKALEVEAKQAYADGRLVVKLRGVDDRDVARSFMGLDLGVNPDQLPEPPADEFYWVDLIGCTVENVSGQTLGVVTEMMETGAKDVMRVKTAEGVELIPFAFGAVVQSVDVAQKRILVHWEIGYFEA